VLIGKWQWHFASEPDAQWQKVVEAKYGSVRGGWRSRDNAGSHGMGLWRFISRNWHHFSSHTKLIPGDGSRISFWEELWCGNSTLKEAFPGLYNIASNKEASIADNIDLSSGSHQWNVSFLPSLNDWEVDDLIISFMLIIWMVESTKFGGFRIGRGNMQ
jgi:hypothetical protein